MDPLRPNTTASDEPAAKRARPIDPSPDVNVAFNVFNIVKELETNKQSLKLEVKTLNNQLAECNETIETLNKRIDAYETEKAEFAEQHAQICQQHREEILVKDNEIRNLKSENQQARFENARLSSEVNRHADQLATERMDIEKQEKAHRELAEHLESGFRAVRTARRQLKEDQHKREMNIKEACEQFMAKVTAPESSDALEFWSRFDRDMEAFEQREMLQEQMLNQMRARSVSEPRARAPRALLPVFQADLNQDQLRCQIDRYVESKRSIYSSMKVNHLLYDPRDAAPLPQKVEQVPSAHSLKELIFKAPKSRGRTASIHTKRQNLLKEQQVQVNAGIIEVVAYAVQRDMSRDYETINASLNPYDQHIFSLRDPVAEQIPRPASPFPKSL